MKIEELFLTGKGKRLVRIVSWVHPDEREPDTFMLIDEEILELLDLYLDEGKVVEEIRVGLEEALVECPEWENLCLEELNRHQRENIIGRFILKEGEELEEDKKIEIVLY
jgi:hypothetical protein